MDLQLRQLNYLRIIGSPVWQIRLLRARQIV